MSLILIETYMFIKFKRHLIEIAKNEIISSEAMDVSNWVFQAYVKTFDALPNVVYGVCYSDIDDDEQLTSLENFVHNISDYLKENGLDKKPCDVLKTTENILKEYPDSIKINIFPHKPIIYNDSFIVLPSYKIVIFHENEINEKVFSCFVSENINEDKPRVYYVSKGSYGFETYPFTLNVKDIEGNYNDDLPLNKINSIIQNDNSGIILFNGEPGTGKSSFIRYLIDVNKKNKEFLYLDSDVFNAMTDSSFISFLLRHKNSVIILEDCEKVLQTRDGDSRNELISTILNISDGLLGDSLNLKFICTFNTDLTNIDKAILRKGRLKLKYEFKPLAKEKVAKIFEKRGINPQFATKMTLADIYNYDDDNGNKECKKSIGFSV